MTDFLQLTVEGIAYGFRYALVALGFVVIFKATGVINFAQGGLVMFGAYFAYNAGVTWGLPFWLAVIVAMIATAGVGLLIERLILRHMVGRPPFALIMITVGLLFVLQTVCEVIWDTVNLNLGDPWGIETVAFGDVIVPVRHLWAIGAAGVVVALFFVMFRFTSIGLAMRATAVDQEAALAQGMSASRVFATSWAIAGATAALAGVMTAAGPTALGPQVQFVALLAFPAIILGGLDSPGGAVLGGLIIGLTQSYTARLQPEYMPWLGTDFQAVMPFVVMVIILLVRPYGLFGTPEVKRV